MTEQQQLLPLGPGEILALKRNERGLSLSEAAKGSGISRHLLEALESGNTEHVPGIYLKGHYRKYARFLDVEDEAFDSQVDDIDCSAAELRTIFQGKESSSNGERWLKVSGYLAASVMIVALAWQFTHEAVRFSQGDSPARSKTAASESAETGSADRADESAERTHLNASIAAVEVLRQPVAEPAGPDAAAEAWDAIRDPAASAGEHLLVIETSADSWVEIYGENESRLEMDLVRAGSSREYRGKGPFNITIGRASAVILTMDGAAVDLEPHTHDDVASLLLATAPAGENSGAGKTDSH